MLDWHETLSKEILPQVVGDDQWEDLISKAISNDSHPAGIHVAIFSEPFLSYLLDGKKKIDSRFSTRRFPPYGKVSEGDIVLVKASGGPVRAVCQVGKVWFYKLNEDSWAQLREEYAEQLCAMDPKFWDDRKNAAYATLMQLKIIREIEPVSIKKRDRRSWAVLRSTIGKDGFEII